jgi:putative hydrolase of the HAD superfamily
MLSSRRRGEANTMLQAVIFDYGGVLRGDGREIWTAADATASLPPGTLWAAWHDIPEYRLSREGAIDGLAFRAAIHRALIPVAGDTEQAEAALAALEAALAGLPPIDTEMRALIDRLRAARRVKLGLLSNANHGFTERLRARGVANFFDDVVVSADVGLAKPDPAIFRLAAERLGVVPEACLMIDDQAQHVEGARAAGLRAHLWTKPLHEPTRLRELIAWLESEGVLP